MGDKKRSSLFLLALVFALGVFVFAGGVSAVPATPITITVNTTGYNLSGVYHASSNPIQDAIGAAQSNDVIQVAGGSYAPFWTGYFVSNLTIEAMSGQIPIIVANSTNVHSRRAIWLYTNNNTVKGFTVVGNGDMNDLTGLVGISVTGNNENIEGNTVHHLLTGIQTAASNSSTSTNNQITGNTVYDAKVGISLQNDGNYVNVNNLTDVETGFGIASKSTNWGTNSINANVSAATVHWGGSNDNKYTGSIQDAINGVNAGDIIDIVPGNYNLTRDQTTSVLGQTGWYLYVTKNGITLQGVDSNGNNVTNASNVSANLYSMQETPNGAWSTQDLIMVTGDNVTFSGLGIMTKVEPNKGIEVLGNNFKAENCKFSPIPEPMFNGIYNGDNISEYGSGVYFNNNGATASRSAVVVNNIFDNSGVTFDSLRDNWNISIINNTFDGNRMWESGGVDYYYSSIGATTWANQPNFTGSQINIYDNKFLNMNYSQILLKIKSGMTGSFNAQNNYWGSASPNFTALVQGNVAYAPWYANSNMTGLTIGQTPAVTNNETGEKETTVAQPINLTNTQGVNVEIPANVIISSNDTSWTGEIQPPTVQNVSIINVTNVPNATNVIEVGVSGTPLTFTKAVKIVIPGAAGSSVGYSYNNGTTFTKINTICTQNNQSWADTNLSTGGDCYTYSGSDLVIWTKHFTQFITYNSGGKLPSLDSYSYSPDYPSPKENLNFTVRLSDPYGINLAQIEYKFVSLPDPSSSASFQSGSSSSLMYVNLNQTQGNEFNGTWSPSGWPPPQTDGYYKIRIKAGDNNGNTSYYADSTHWLIQNITVDGRPPNTTINYGGNRYVTNTTQIKLNSTDPGYAAYPDYIPSGVNYTSYKISNSSNPGSWTNVTGNYTNFTLAGLTDGNYTIQYYSVDNAGNVEPTQSTTLTLDNTAPLISYTTNTPANDSYTNKDNFVENVSVVETNFANVTLNLYNASSGSLNKSVTYTNGTRAVNWTGLADGVYKYDAVAYDLAGNVNSTVNRTITIDTKDPVVAISYPTNATVYNANTNQLVNQLNYTATDTNLAMCWYSTDNGVTNSTTQSCSGSFSGVSSVEGLNNWTVYASDKAGNIGSDKIVFTKDTVAPLISFGTGTTAAGNYSQSYIVANVSAVDPSPGTGVNRTITYLYNTSGLVLNFTNSTSPAVNNFTGLANGVYYLNATSYDNAGNPASTSTRRIVLDNTPPSLAITSTINNTIMSGMTAYTLQVNSSDNLTGVKAVTMVLFNSSSGENVLNSSMSKVSGTSLYQKVFYPADLPAGNYTLNVTSVDYAGNNVTVTKAFEISDNVAQLGDVVPIVNQVSASAGGTVSFVLPVTVRGNGTIVFGMDNLAGFSPSYLNATISNGNQTAAVGQGINFTGAAPLTLTDANPSLPNIQNNVTLSLEIPGNDTIPSGSYTIHYYINNA